MNTKTALGIVVAFIVIVGGYFFMRPATTRAPANPALQNVATTSPATRVQTAKTPEIRVSSSFVQFDSPSPVSTSTYPTVTGTANVPSVSVTIYTSRGVGIVSSSDIPVKGGHWSYSCSVALVPGTYVLVLYNGSATATQTLTVKKP